MKVVIDDTYPNLFAYYKMMYDNGAGFPAPDPVGEVEDFLIKNHLAVRTRQMGTHIHVDFPKAPWSLRFRAWLHRFI